MRLSDRIIPSPQEVVEIDEKFVFTKDSMINYSATRKKISGIIKSLVSELETLNIKIKNVKPDKKLANCTIIISHTENIDLVKYKTLKPINHTEGYTLYVGKDCIVLSAISPAGLFYATQSLIQLVDSCFPSFLRTSHRNDNKNVVPGCKIRDWPMFTMRGVSDDISRWQISTPENFKKIIHILSTYKLNTYMPYIEDVFKLKKHPLVGKNRGVLTPQEVREIVRYGKERFVEVIPIFQTLGHCEHLLRIKKYRELAEIEPKPHSGPLLTPVGEGTTLSPANPKTYQFINDFADELLPNFESKYIHIGGDEPYDLGKGKSKKNADRIGVENLYRQHMEKVAKMMTKYHKQIIMYADIVLNHWRERNFDPAYKPNLSREIILMNWWYAPQDDYPEIRKISEAGYTQIVSPSLQNYIRFYPAYNKARKNIRNLILTGWKTKNVIGAITSSWGDDGADNFRENNWYGYAYTAECAWHPDKVDDRTFTKRFTQQFFGNNYGVSDIIDYLAGIDEIFYAARRPFMEDLVIRKQDNENLTKTNVMLANCQKYLKKIDNIQPKIFKNIDNLDYLKFALQLSQNFTKRLLILHRIACGTKIAKLEIMQYIKELIQIKTDFAKLWLRTNKPAGLWVTLWRLDKLINQWRGLSNIK